MVRWNNIILGLSIGIALPLLLSIGYQTFWPPSGLWFITIPLGVFFVWQRYKSDQESAERYLFWHHDRKE